LQSASEGGADETPPSNDQDAASRRIAELEVENGLRQFDLAENIISTFLEPDRPFALRPSVILQLQAIAVEGIEKRPGEWRTGNVEISKSAHQPPGPHLVPNLVQEMCDYVNENLHERTPIHLAAYVMWRLNWIHPFSDGNGRTSRIVSYIVLSAALKLQLPGNPSIPQQIQADRTTYFRALEEADATFLKTGQPDVTAMETALKGMLATQLLSVIRRADGA
jgi:Fic family protein